MDRRVVVVTGGTGYLGSAVCKAFLEGGSTVVAVYLFDKEVPFFEETLGRLAKEAVLMRADASKPGEMDRVAKDVVRQFKRIDVLVNTVGGYVAGPVEETSAEDLDRAVSLNLRPTFLACKAVAGVMRRAKRGKIVNVSSESSLLGDEGSFLYSATKAGVNRLTESLARELRPADIQVNCVMPRILDTPANREAMPDADVSTWVRTDQVARVIRWLASEDADVITGAAIPVYGAP